MACLIVIATAGVAIAVAGAQAEAPPRGHLQPFGAWADGTPVEERSDVPEPEDFYRDYCNADGGFGKPVIFRGAARGMAAFKDWTTDDALLEQYSSERVTQVEYNLKETRAGGSPEHIKTMGSFLKEYNSSDIYMVSGIPGGMMKDVDFLPCLRCGGYLNYLDTHTMWMGRGGSKSVVHYDDQDNINCMVFGRKRFIFMHPRYKEQFEAHPNSKKNKFGWVDADLSPQVKGYGAFFGKIDVDKMDLINYPGWRDVQWSYADLQPGDCVYIPFQWYHQVKAEPSRQINVHVWYWRPAAFDGASCADAPALAPSFADCNFGYEPNGGHLGSPPKGGRGKALTRCSPRGTGHPPPKAKRRRRAAASKEL